ncbi:MAG TPA: hypothetical protein ENN41_09140 [Sediminispirochaeta sp.]|nr:hypothetical protein [Sediminispirochaeta sp.]
MSSFYQGDVGPIIRREIREAQPETGDFFLVYLHESMRPQVVEELEKRGLKHQVFPQPGEDFVAALASCRGVITNAGHQLLSETLHLKKPVLSLPFEKQYEQTLNAKMLEKSGRGIVGRLTSLEEYLDKYLSFTEHFDPSYRPSEAGVHFRLEDDSRRAIDLLQRHLEQRERVS